MILKASPSAREEECSLDLLVAHTLWKEACSQAPNTTPIHVHKLVGIAQLSKIPLKLPELFGM